MNESFSKTYFGALLDRFAGLTTELPAISDAADRIATRLLSGGRLLLASVRPDFASEGYIRGGGLMLVEEWKPATSLSPDDTVIFGWSDSGPQQESELLLRLRESGALIIGIGPAAPTWTGVDALPSTDLLSPSQTPVPAAATEPFGDDTYPLMSLQNLVILWVLTSEIVSALSRSGKMPAMYQSVLVQGARERNGRAGPRFHETHEVPAIAPGQLGASYIQAISKIFQTLIDEETVAIDDAAKRCGQVLQAGRVVYAGMISHFPMHQHGAPGDPLHMQRLSPLDAESPSVPELENKLQAGDLFFFLGYYRRPVAAYQTARQAGAFIVEVITGDGSDDGSGDGNDPRPDHIIRPRWPFGDALISVPGYDVEILPASGIVQAAIYWAVVGSISQALIASRGAVCPNSADQCPPSSSAAGDHEDL